MVEAKISNKDGFNILTDRFNDEWAVSVYDDEDGRYIEFYNDEGEPVNYLLSDVINFLQNLTGKEMEGNVQCKSQ